MGAIVIRLGEPPSTFGGDCEREVASLLERKLPDGFILICNPSFPTESSFFYEYDLIVVHPYFCEVLEVKNLMGSVTVHEYAITTEDGYIEDRVFDTLENKAKVLSSRLRHAPFGLSEGDRVVSRVVLGPQCRKIEFRYPRHEVNAKVLSCRQLATHYRDRAWEANSKHTEAERQARRHKVLNAWRTFEGQAVPTSRTRDSLGRFLIIRQLVPGPPREYLGVDEPPCKALVHLKEFPYVATSTRRELEHYLEKVSHEMQALRRIRHPNICCVTGHFRTGHSLVQVSDWFDGRPISQSWDAMEELLMGEKLRLVLKMAQGLGYCHSQGVFHRNLDAAQILIDETWDEVRIQGFEFAKNLDATHTMTEESLGRRDPRLTPPEDLIGNGSKDPRQSDIFQLGILLYRIVENGEWPFENTLDYFTGDGQIRNMRRHEDEPGVEGVRQLVARMLSIKPADRPDPIAAVEASLGALLDQLL